MKNDELIYLDLIGGIAGDMFIAAMVDCDPSLKNEVLKNTKAVLPQGVGSLHIHTDVNKGISGARAEFVAASAVEETSLKIASTTYAYLSSIIGGSSLNDAVKEIAHSLLTLVARSEAKIHSIPIEKVHFHELADWDSLMDIVAIATILDKKREAQWQVSNIPIGRGRVSTAHGLLPVPAPATLDLLQGFDFIDDGEQGERVTPTGAVILRYLKDTESLKENCEQSKVLQLSHIGYGLGTKVFDTLPNILRASIYTRKNTSLSNHKVAVVSFEIDDMTGEEIAVAFEQLRQIDGIFDVCSASVRGKKGRHMEAVQILAEPNALQRVTHACFVYTSTIGLRTRIESRQCLERELLDTEHGQVKTVFRPDNTQTRKLESDALQAQKSLKDRRAKKMKAEYKVEIE